jgi:hypothetical protein
MGVYALLVFLLSDCNAGIFVRALLDSFDNRRHFVLQFGVFPPSIVVSILNIRAGQDSLSALPGTPLH